MSKIPTPYLDKYGILRLNPIHEDYKRHENSPVIHVTWLMLNNDYSFEKVETFNILRLLIDHTKLSVYFGTSDSE